MPTRQELQVGRDLIVRTNWINNAIMTAVEILQGTKVLMKVDSTSIDEAGKKRPATVEEIRNEIDALTQRFTMSYSNQISDFLLKSDESLSDKGLGHFNVGRPMIDEDLLTEYNTRIGYQAVKGNLIGKDDLVGYGVDLENAVDFSINVDERLFKLPRDAFILNVCNDLLDAVSFELRDINSHNGQKMHRSVEEIKAHVADRFVCIERNSWGFHHSEMTQFVVIANTVQNNLFGATTPKDLSDIADYIDANVPKLPLVRRAWSL